MGIQGLLPLMRPITRAIHVRDLAGLRVGVDAYVWLHRGVYSCATELCQGRPTTRYLNLCINRLKLLLDHGVHVYVIFDGGPLPAKQLTEHERRARREDNKLKGFQCLERKQTKEAFAYFSRAVDVTPTMAHEWIKTIKDLPNVSYMVAPYEADAQLAYLCKEGLIDAVISEDSDILAFGCPRLISKLEENGQAQEIRHADLFRAPIGGFGDMRAWDRDAFLAMCILSGCDYIPSLPGMGLRSAYQLIERHKTAIKVIKAMKFKDKPKVPHDYEDRFKKAFFTFRHQRVFDPRSRTLVHVHPLPLELQHLPPAETEYLGPILADNLAAAIADGSIDPITKEPFPAAANEGATHFPFSHFMKNDTNGAQDAAATAKIAEALPTSSSHQEFDNSANRKPKKHLGFNYCPILQKNMTITSYLRTKPTANVAAAVKSLLPSQKRKRSENWNQGEGKGDRKSERVVATEQYQRVSDRGKSSKSEECLPQMSTWFRSSANGGDASGDKEKMTIEQKGPFASCFIPIKRQAPLKSSNLVLRCFSSTERSGTSRTRDVEKKGQTDDNEEEKKASTPLLATKALLIDCRMDGVHGDILQPPTLVTPFGSSTYTTTLSGGGEGEDEEGGDVSKGRAANLECSSDGCTNVSASFEQFSYSERVVCDAADKSAIPRQEPADCGTSSSPIMPPPVKARPTPRHVSEGEGGEKTVAKVQKARIKPSSSATCIMKSKSTGMTSKMSTRMAIIPVNNSTTCNVSPKSSHAFSSYMDSFRFNDTGADNTTSYFG